MMTTEEERLLRMRIAYRITAELVCCDVYERQRHGETIDPRDMHQICLWGGYAANIAIETLDETLDEVLDQFNRGEIPWPVAPYQQDEA